MLTISLSKTSRRLKRPGPPATTTATEKPTNLKARHPWGFAHNLLISPCSRRIPYLQMWLGIRQGGGGSPFWPASHVFLFKYSLLIYTPAPKTPFLWSRQLPDKSCSISTHQRPSNPVVRVAHVLQQRCTADADYFKCIPNTR